MTLYIVGGLVLLFVAGYYLLIKKGKDKPGAKNVSYRKPDAKPVAKVPEVPAEEVLPPIEEDPEPIERPIVHPPEVIKEDPKPREEKEEKEEKEKKHEHEKEEKKEEPHEEKKEEHTHEEKHKEEREKKEEAGGEKHEHERKDKEGERREHREGEHKRR